MFPKFVTNNSETQNRASFLLNASSHCDSDFRLFSLGNGRNNALEGPLTLRRN